MNLPYRLIVKVTEFVSKVAYALLQLFFNLLVRYVPRKTIHKLFVDYRSWIIAFIVVPLSFVYDLFIRARSWIVWYFFQVNVLHDIKVQNIQNQVLEWKKNGSTKKMVSIFFVLF